MYIEHAKQLGANKRYTIWKDAIAKYMYQVLVDFKILEDGEYPPPGWKNSTGNIIFDVKMDLTRKEIWVKDDHYTPDP